MSKPVQETRPPRAPWPRMYAVVRTDLGDVPSGKLMGSAGHAFVGAFYDSFDTALNREGTARRYAESEEHPKIVLGAGRGAIVELGVECKHATVPHHMVYDFGLTTFKERTLVALGIGPIFEREYREIGLDKLELFR